MSDDFPSKYRPQTEEEATLLRAKTALAEAETVVAKAEARQKTAYASQQELNLQRETFKRELELVTDYHKRVYRFLGVVNSSSVMDCIDILSGWHRIDPECDITIVFNSPGGSVVDGLALYDFLTELRASGHKLTTVARGMAASMAGILLQAGDERIMGAEASLLIHEASFGVAGSMGDVIDRVEWLKKIQDRILDIFASRCKLSKAQLKTRWTRKDWWLTSDEALKLGLVDVVGGGGVV